LSERIEIFGIEPCVAVKKAGTLSEDRPDEPNQPH
jgi:hypothetical protein